MKNLDVIFSIAIGSTQNLFWRNLYWVFGGLRCCLKKYGPLSPSGRSTLWESGDKEVKAKIPKVCDFSSCQFNKHKVNLINSWGNRAGNESLYFAISLSTSFSDLMV